MSNFLFLHPLKSLDLKEIKKAINLPQTFEVQSFQEDDKIFAVSFHNNAPLKGKRIFNNEQWTILFAGDMVDNESIPYQKFIDYTEDQLFYKFKDFNGIFSIFLYNKKEKKLFLIGDRRSQQTVYYSIDNENIIFATDLSLFVKLLENPEFNKNWLYDYLFFSFAIGQTTFLKNVYKMPPESFLIYDYETKLYQLDSYTDQFTINEKLLKNKAALEYAKEVFAKRVPKYFIGSNRIACAITDGWDGRTNLILAPDPDKVTSFTYGIAGCNDLKGGRIISDKIKIRHKEVLFDSHFVTSLPNYMYETVYLSSGLQGF